jgi:hypothetical protein
MGDYTNELLQALIRAETWMREYAREFDPMPLDGGQTLNMLMSDIHKAHAAIVKATDNGNA